MRIVLLLPKRIPWHSMDEILPSIEKSWRATAIRRRAALKIVRVGERPNIMDLGPLLKADVIGAGFLSPAVFWALWALRAKLRIRTPFLLHTHGEGTAGMARVRELARILTKEDTFLCACRAEAASIRACYARATTVVLPFPIASLYPALRARKRFPAAGRLVFVGRISEQKNLHTLLLALALLRRRRPSLDWRLDLYGKADGWGSPNMGFRMTDYPGCLKKLSRRLGIASRVRWRGFQSRTMLHRRVLAEPHVFVSPSLHSDEDFGVAALKSLLTGHRAVLSDWGGHRDLRAAFPARTKLVGAYRSPLGPFLRPDELARELESALRSPPPAPAGTPARYDAAQTSRTLEALLRRAPKRISRPLTPTPAARELWRRLGALKAGPLDPGFEARRFPERLFFDYRDPLTRAFFRAYGARTGPKDAAKGALWPAPWVRLSKNSLKIRDPHRGPLTLPASKGTPDWLRRNGLAYPEALEIGT